MTTFEDFERERVHLQRLAYRLLGTVAEAEDMVQETFVRWRAAGEPRLDSPRAWFTRTCTRLCLDRIRSSQRTREQYPGEWLPEPLVEQDRAELDDTLSMALLRTIQRLRPAERAVFLLHDVFDHSFAEVAEILDLTQPHCRQLAVRARRSLGDDRVRSDADPATIERLTRAFSAAIDAGDLDGLRSLLGDDVVLHSDGGGRVAAALRPVVGADSVIALLDGVFLRRSPRPVIDTVPVWFNGAPGTVLFDGECAATAFQLQVVDGRVTRIFAVRNPEKLRSFHRS